jgi:ribosomal protein S18 acetylase RimI-like enzyme
MKLKLVFLTSLLAGQTALPAAKELIKLGGAVRAAKNISSRLLPMISRISMPPWPNLDPADPRNYLAFGVMATLAATATVVNSDSKSEMQVVDFDPARDTKFVIDCINASDRQLAVDPTNAIRAVLKHDFSPGQVIFIKKIGGWAKYLKVIFVKGKPAGFIFYQSGPGAVAAIEALAVHPGYRRHGCASKLLEYAITQLEGDGKTRLELSVFSSNDKAKSLYAKFGFKPTGKSAWYEGQQVELVEFVRSSSR